MACLFPWNEVQLNVPVVSWWFLIQSEPSRPRWTGSNSNLVCLKVYLWIVPRQPGFPQNDIVPRQGENGEWLIFTLISDFHRQGNRAHPCFSCCPSISKGHRETAINNPRFHSMFTHELRRNEAMGWPLIQKKDCLLSINLPFKPEKFFQVSWKVDVADLVVIGNRRLRCEGQILVRKAWDLSVPWLTGRKSWSGFVFKVQISTGSSSKFSVLISGSWSLTRFAVLSPVNGTLVGLNGFEVIVLLLNFR